MYADALHYCAQQCIPILFSPLDISDCNIHRQAVEEMNRSLVSKYEFLARPLNELSLKEKKRRQLLRSQVGCPTIHPTGCLTTFGGRRSPS